MLCGLWKSFRQRRCLPVYAPCFSPLLFRVTICDGMRGGGDSTNAQSSTLSPSLSLWYHTKSRRPTRCCAAADELAEIPMQMRSPPKIIDHTREGPTTDCCITEADRRPFPFSIHSTICFLAERGSCRRQFGRLEWRLGSGFETSNSPLPL